MPNIYIYLPVANQTLIDFAVSWKHHYEIEKAKGEADVICSNTTGFIKGLRRKVGLRLLRDVPADGKLYVLIHGAHREGYRGAEKVSADRSSGKKKMYDPQQLAKHLKDERLNIQFQNLHLYACSGGVVPTPDHGTTPAPNAANLSLAERLRNELFDLGYLNINVTGYLDDLRMAIGSAYVEHGDAPHPHAIHLTAADHKVTASGYRASYHKVTF